MSGARVEHMIVLRTVPAFAGLADDELAVVAGAVTERIVAPGEVLLAEGQRMSRTVVVAEGSVRMEEAGRVVKRSDRRDGVGILGMLADYRSERAVVADSRSRVLVLERDRLLDAMEEDFAVLAHVMRYVAGAIIETYLRLDLDFRAPERERPPPPHLRVRDRELDLVERILAVRQVPAFGRSSLDSVARYAKLLEQRFVAAGTLLWAEGDPCETYLHIVSGRMRGERRGGGGALDYGPPTMPGLFGVLSGRETRWYTATAETDLVVLRVDREVILDLLEDDFEMAARCLQLSARRLIRFLALRDAPT